MLLALALATVANFAHASRTDSDGEPLRAPSIARVHGETRHPALGIGHQDGALNRPTQTIAPEPFSLTELFAYELARNRLTATNRRDKTTTYDDDALNRVARITDPAPLSFERNFGYDLRRRMSASTNGAEETTAYFYDGNGNRTGVRHPRFAVSGNPCAEPSGLWGYEYDDANRLVAVVDPLQHRTEYEYDGNSNRTVQLDANLHATVFAFDELNRLTWKTYPGGAPADVETYGYDENGNRTSLIDPKGQSFAYGYDALDRLTTETLPNPAPPTGDELRSAPPPTTRTATSPARRRPIRPPGSRSRPRPGTTSTVC